MCLLAKHTFASIVVVAASVAFAALSYFALLAWAVVAGQGIGGPLAFPFMLLLALIAALAGTVAVLFPVTALAELVSSRLLHWQRLAQIPVSAGLLVGWVIGVAMAVGLSRGAFVEQAARAGVLLVAILLVPLGLYWWSLQSADLVLELVARLFRRLLHPSDSAGARATRDVARNVE